MRVCRGVRPWWCLAFILGCGAEPAALDGGSAVDAAPDAAFDDAAARVPACGDGILDEDEACDGQPVEGDTCAAHGFTSGALGCTSTCTIDLSSCSGRCGDGVLEQGEDCEPGQPIARTCEDLGAYAGELRCSATCAWDLTLCGGRCGDGVIQSPEVCDGAATTETCASRGFFRGALACDLACAHDERGCYPTRVGAADGETRLSRFSPSGDRLFTFERDGDGGPWRLMARHIESGAITMIAELESFPQSQIEISADGSRVLYATPGSASVTECTVHLYDFATARPREIATGVPCDQRPGTFSPDGAYVAVVTDVRLPTATLSLLDVSRGSPAVLTRALVVPSPVLPDAWAFTPDGRRLLYFDQGNAAEGTGTLHARDLSTGVTVEVDRAVYVDQRGFRLSPDGRRLAYFRACVVYICDLVERDLDGGAPIEIAARVHGPGTWLSPTWTSAVLLRVSRTGTVSLLNRADPTPHRLPESWVRRGAARPVYSPDGSQLVYAGLIDGTEEKSRLFHVDVRTGTVTPIARHIPGWSIERPMFTVDGRAVLFTRQEYPRISADRRGDVYLLTLGGATATVALAATSPVVLGQAQQWLATTYEDDGHVVLFDRATGAAVLSTGDHTSILVGDHPRWLVYASQAFGGPVTSRGLFLFDLSAGGAPVRLSASSSSQLVSSDTHFAVVNGRGAFLDGYPQ
jgi:Tol biopolymer transport system component